MTTSESDFRFPKRERLSGKKAFDRVFAEGRVFRGKAVVVRSLANGLAYSRLGLSVGRKVGPATRRNRVKRLIREAYRLNKHALLVPCDMVVVPRPGFPADSLHAVERDVVSLMEKINASLTGKQDRR